MLPGSAARERGFMVAVIMAFMDPAVTMEFMAIAVMWEYSEMAPLTGFQEQAAMDLAEQVPT